MKICIYGAGAMGTSLGALLKRAGVGCDLVTRNNAHVTALNERGAKLSGSENTVIPVHAITPDEIKKGYDLIFLSAKQRQNGEIATFLADYLKEDGAIVSTQNGLPEQRLAEIFGQDRTYGCTLSWGAERTGAGEIKISSENGYYFSLGACGKGERLNEIKEILQKIGTVTVGELREIRFAKLAINASFSTLSALSGLTFGELAKKHKKAVLLLMREVFAVAKGAGCKQLPLNGHDLFRVFGGVFAKLLLPIAMKKYQDTRSGMLLALGKGERCEIDYISGAVVEAGKRYGVQTPKQAQAVALVHDVENGLCELSPETITLLLGEDYGL